MYDSVGVYLLNVGLHQSIKITAVKKGHLIDVGDHHVGGLTGGMAVNLVELLIFPLIFSPKARL